MKPPTPSWPTCEWCEKAAATELLVRDRPTREGGRHRACTLACTGCGDRVSRLIARIEDIEAMYRLAISPLIPASEEVAS
jgi:hypothetical protein